jgi:hypothetical protein
MGDDEKVDVTHNIDFNEIGIYKVELTGKLYAPIRVIGKELVEKTMGIRGEVFLIFRSRKLEGMYISVVF